MVVALGLLGPPEVRRDDVPLDLSARSVALLTRLAIAGPGRPVSIERLLEDLWPDQALDKDVRALHTLVSRLRATARKLDVPNPVVTSGNAYRLGFTPEQVDVVRFERLLDGGRRAISVGDDAEAVAQLRAAEALWRGPALEGFAGESWALLEATRLDELRLQCVEERIDVELTLGLAGPLTAELETLVEAHPVRERFWGQLMEALYYAGRQSDALRRYQSLRTYLSEELGLEPSPPLQELEGQILQQSLALPTPVATRATPRADAKTNLPAPVDAFIGREDERKAITEAFTEHRLVSLVGPGGVGKTRLALESARDGTGAFPDGTWLVDLGDLDASDADAADRIVWSLAGTVGAAADEGIDGLAAALAGGALIVLDTCERHIDAAAAFCEGLLSAAPAVAILATSREALRCRGEAMLRVEPLVIEEAVALFEARGAAVNLGSDRATDAGLAVRVCEALDCLPLAIELASSRLGEMHREELAHALEAHLGALGARRGGPERQRTLEATIAWSTESMTSDEFRVLCRLSVFAGGWTPDAAASVCAHDGVDATVVDAVVASLEGRSLVAVVGARRRLLDVVRSYAAEQLDDEERRRVGDRHLAWAVAFTEAVLSRESGGDPTVREDQYADQANMRVALAHAIETAQAEAAQMLAAAQTNLWQDQAAFAEGRSWLDAALALGGSGTARCRALAAAALLASRMADPIAVELAQAAVEVAGVDPSTAAEAWTMVALVAHGEGGASVVVDALRRAQALAREGDDESVLLVASTNLGIGLAGGEDHREAVAALREAAAIEERFGASTARMCLADALRESGELDEAFALLDGVERDVRGVWETLQFAGIRARCLLAAGRAADALDVAGEAMALSADADLTLSTGFGTLEAVIALIALARPDEALAILEDPDAAGLRERDQQVLRVLADAYTAHGDFAAAHETLALDNARTPIDYAAEFHARLALREGRPEDVETLVHKTRLQMEDAGLLLRARVLSTLEDTAQQLLQSR